MKAQRLREAFQKLKRDSERLAEGSAQLKEMIQNSNPHTYSIGTFKKAEDLEKLARKIKNRIKRGFR
jgi:F0F1-type ATP synthase membrane subunit b/b'